MESPWARLRRLAASLMLAAMAAFVLHGAALAGSHRHGPGLGAPEAGHVHDAGGGEGHHLAAPEVGPAAALDEAPAADPHPGPKVSCGGACGFLIAVCGPAPLPARPAAFAPLLPQDQAGAGIDPHGQRRPPRTPCIA